MNGKRFKHNKNNIRCIMTNKVVCNKEVVIVDYAIDYVKKMGYIVTQPKRFNEFVKTMFSIFLLGLAVVFLCATNVKASEYDDCSIYGNCLKNVTPLSCASGLCSCSGTCSSSSNISGKVTPTHLIYSNANNSLTDISGSQVLPDYINTGVRYFRLQNSISNPYAPVLVSSNLADEVGLETTGDNIIAVYNPDGSYTYADGKLYIDSLGTAWVNSIFSANSATPYNSFVGLDKEALHWRIPFAELNYWANVSIDDSLLYFTTDLTGNDGGYIFDKKVSGQSLISTTDRFCNSTSCYSIAQLLNDTEISSTFNSTYASTSADVTSNRSAWFSTYNATYAQWAYNQTINFGTFNSTYDATVSFNKTNVAYLNETNQVFTQLNTTKNIYLVEGNGTDGQIWHNNTLWLWTIGTGNLFMGTNNARAGKTTTTGTYNLGIGRAAMSSVTDGSNNVAVGSATLISCTSCSNNMAIGAGALQQLTNGADNMAIGASSMALGTGEQFNVGIGTISLYKVTGYGNVAIGRGAGYNVTTGAYNVFIGYNSGLYNQSTSASYSIAIGSDTITTKSGQAVYGTNMINETTLWGGNVTIMGNVTLPANSLIRVGANTGITQTNNMRVLKDANLITLVKTYCDINDTIVGGIITSRVTDC